MEPPIILEILDRFGKIRERHRLTQFPLRLGRGYDNDIIIDDPYISPTHLELILDGNQHLILNDNASDNGVYNIHPLQRLDSVMLHENQRVRIGHTDLRFRSCAFPVKKTVLDLTKPRGTVGKAFTMLLLPIAWALISGLLLWNNYLDTVSDASFGQVLSKTLPWLIFLPLWAFAWSIVSKIVTHRFYYLYHAVWVSVLAIAIILFDTLMQYIEFMSAIDFLADRVTLFTDVIFIAVLFYGHLHYSTTYNKRTAAIIGTSTGLVLTLVIQLSSYLAQPDFNNQPQYSGVLKPPAFVIRHGKDIDTFFADSVSLRGNANDTDDNNSDN
ncbi:MAG: FHA domain-containing protein [Gammaproteobacteria bacterium]|nr:FHA domain-containing protein [Gammaproteobacteria bacterium]